MTIMIQTGALANSPPKSIDSISLKVLTLEHQVDIGKCDNT